MDSARSVKRAAMILVGESLREMAVLIAVFAPLDMIVQGWSLTVRSVAAILLTVVPVFALGLFLEVRQPWKG
jgi:cyanate permease